MKREQGQIDRVIAVHGLRLCVYPVTSYIKGSNVVKPDVLEIRYVGLFCRNFHRSPTIHKLHLRST